MKVKRPSWDYMYSLAKDLAKQIKKDNYKPDVLIGLTRGGLVPAMYLSDLLGVSEIITLRVEHYADAGKTYDRPITKFDATYDLKGMKVLVVDDASDSGKSLDVAMKKIKEFNPGEIKVATLHLRETSMFKPHYTAESMEDYWIMYPWNIIEEVLGLIRRKIDKGENVDIDWITATLHESFGIDVSDIAEEVYEIGKERKLF